MFNSFFHSTSLRVGALAATLAVSAAGFSSCGISEQVQQAKAFKGVDVRLVNVEQATLAGIDDRGTDGWR